MSYDIIDKEFCQDALKTEIENKFTEKKKYSVQLSESYKRLGFVKKSQNVASCGTYLEFRRPVPSVAAEASALGAVLGTTSDGWKLHNANFCRDRLCPMCQWRRSYKIFAQVSKVMDKIENEFVFLFLTLTVPNCSGNDLKKTIAQMQRAFNKLMNYSSVKKAVCGYFKALEVTINKNNGTFHPHFHVILCVDEDYFDSKKDKYISHDKWLDMWRKAMNNDTITQVDIRRVKPKEQIQEGEKSVKSLGAAVAEVAKYSVKSSDYLKSNIKMTDTNVAYLVIGLSSCRLCSFGGIMEQIRVALNLDDYEDGDLIHIVGDEIRSDVAYMIRTYRWSCGAYKLLDEQMQVNIDIEVLDDEV